MRSTTFDYRGFIRVEFEDELLETVYPTLYRETWVELADRTGGISIFIRGFADQPYFKGPFSGSSLNSLVKITGYNSKELNEIANSTLDFFEGGHLFLIQDRDAFRRISAFLQED